MFHQQLAYCTTQFVEKDPQTAEPIILGLLKYWPVTASAKEVRKWGSLSLSLFVDHRMLTWSAARLVCRSCF